MAAEGAAVPNVALDGVVTGSGKCIFIKMDIKKPELSAVRGMKARAMRNKVLLQVESFAPASDTVSNEIFRIGMAPIPQIDNNHYFSNP